ncbi:MAG: hypothetical protein WD534_12320 [Phycisphaeraceae bacterium]
MQARQGRDGKQWRGTWMLVTTIAMLGFAWPATAQVVQEAVEAEAAPADAPPAAPPNAAEPEAAPAEAGAEADADEAIDDEELIARFRVIPSSFQSSSYLHFDDDGNVHNEQHSMSMNLNVLYDAEFAPSSYRNFKIDTMVTDAGERLDVQHHNAGEQMIHHHHHGQQQPRFNLGVQVPHPQQPAKRIRKLTGSVEVVLGIGPERHATIGPIKDILGKRIHIANFPDSHLSISRDAHDRMQIQMNGDLMAMLKTVRFYTPAGRELPASQRGSGRSGNTHHRYYQFDMPEDSQIVLTFLSETRVLRVPFELEDIPLPQPETAGNVDLVIRAEPGEPMAQLKLENPAPVADDENALEVRIE